MSFGYLDNLNIVSRMPVNTSFRASTTPAVQKTSTAENPIDTLVKKVDEEKEKKHNKKAIAVTSSVIGISLLVALLNPRYSTKLMERLKASQTKFENKVKTSKDNVLKSKFYQFLSNTQEKTRQFFSYINNFNSVKDTYFKRLCTEESAFSGVRNGSRGFWEKFAAFCRKILKKPHKKITQWSDDLAKFTVKRNYRKASEEMDILEKTIKEYGEKLPADKKVLLENKIRELQSQRAFFGDTNVAERFTEQEKLMENLDLDIRRYLRNYTNGFQSRFIDNKEHFKKNYYFWAEEIMRPAKEGVNKKGTQAVDLLFGNKEGTKGTYNEIVELLSENLSKEDADILRKTINKTEQSLRKANYSECSEYFDKKRDLVLGSAPTDVATALALLGLNGIALASADNRDERISEAITGTVPVITGLGTSAALTSMLVAGPKGLVLGGIAGGIVSLIGSGADNIRLNAKAKMLAKQEINKEAKNV